MKSIILAVMLMMAGEIFAQKSQRIELEIDPIAYALKGYSVHLIHVQNRWRKDLGVFAIQQPEGYGPNVGYKVYSAGVGAKLNYLLNKKETWFAGIGGGYVENNIKHIVSAQTAVQKLVSFGVHAGYRWSPFRNSGSAFKGLYIAPWASLDYNHTLNAVRFDAGPYKQAKLSVFPTVHLGYKF